MYNAENIVGKKFGNLTVMRYEGIKEHKSILLCKCDCGKEVMLPMRNVTSGNTKSCGCFKRQSLVMRNSKHNMYKTPIYQKYQDMLRRCYNKNTKRYGRYGGRGIKVCDEWLPKNNGFANFYKWAVSQGYQDYSDKTLLRKEVPTLDRIDTDGNYEPSNCRFVKFKTQDNNKSSNVYVNYNGKKFTLKQLSEEFDISYHITQKKFHKGLTTEEIVRGYSRLPSNYENRGKLGTLPNHEQRLYNEKYKNLQLNENF